MSQNIGCWGRGGMDYKLGGVQHDRSLPVIENKTKNSIEILERPAGACPDEGF